MVNTGIVDLQKLEKTLIANWTSFVDSRQLLKFAHNVLSYDGTAATQVRISRFELQHNGFVIWLEIVIAQPEKQIKATIECLLLHTGELVPGIIDID